MEVGVVRLLVRGYMTHLLLRGSDVVIEIMKARSARNRAKFYGYSYFTYSLDQVYRKITILYST